MAALDDQSYHTLNCNQYRRHIDFSLTHKNCANSHSDSYSCGRRGQFAVSVAATVTD